MTSITNRGGAARITPVILSGGSGTRLWPMSREARPKQMLALTGEKSLLAITAARVGDEALFGLPVVVTGDPTGIEDVVRDATLIVEPQARNTAPAVALAALHADADGLVLILPSDHLVADDMGFREAVARAVPYARSGWIVTFGMTPDRPDTGYGYIERGKKIGEGVYAAARFVEKPDTLAAQAYVAAGTYDWNGGIFLFRASTMIEALAAHAPNVLEAAAAAMKGAKREGSRVFPAGMPFARAPSISIDYAVMEKARNVAVVPIAVGWSDIGSFEALHAALSQDVAGNVIVGDVLAMGAKNCLLHSEGQLVVALGVSNLVVVATKDVVLIVPRDASQRVKEVVEELRRKERVGVL